MVVGAVDGQGTVQSPGSSSGTKKKKANPTLYLKVILPSILNPVYRSLSNRLLPNLTDPQLTLGLMS